MWTLAACATLYATFATGVLTWWLSGCALTLPPISDFGLSGDGAEVPLNRRARSSTEGGIVWRLS